VRHLVLNSCNDIGHQNGLKGTELLHGIVMTPEEWTPENGLVSAAMKVKRATVAKAYAKEIKVCALLE
jgi:long-chain acyl-CoA synthetase